jgi:ribosomal protein S12 methylthiotransferase accessory factor YcaO
MTCNDPDLLKATLMALADRFTVRDISDREQPVYLTAAIPLRDGLTGLKPRLPAGRGLNLFQAKMSAAAEAVELLASLTRGGLLSGQFPAVNLVSGEAITLPTDHIFLDYSRVTKQVSGFDANSTGCAAGVNPQDARGRALLECVERDAMAIWWYGRQSRRHLPLEHLDLVSPRLSWWLLNRDRKTILIDITSDIGIPVVAAVSAESDGTWVAIGTAASLSVTGALESAVTEMVQTETSMRMAENAGDDELDFWLTHASLLTMPQFRAAELAEELHQPSSTSILSHVVAAGFEPMAVDLTMGEFPLAVARVIVHGLCSMQRGPEKHRILASVHHVKSTFENFETLEPF